MNVSPNPKKATYVNNWSKCCGLLTASVYVFVYS